jgi:hypothetical protein
MSALLEKQHRFVLMVSDLIKRLAASGYQMTFGDAYRDPRVHGQMGEKRAYGHAKSNHKLRLAVDINLFTTDGMYLQNTADYAEAGAIWEAMGGSWGGRFDDGNHFSLEHEGTR